MLASEQSHSPSDEPNLSAASIQRDALARSVEVENALVTNFIETYIKLIPPLESAGGLLGRARQHIYCFVPTASHPGFAVAWECNASAIRSGLQHLWGGVQAFSKLPHAAAEEFRRSEIIAIAYNSALTFLRPKLAPPLIRVGHANSPMMFETTSRQIDFNYNRSTEFFTMSELEQCATMTAVLATLNSKAVSYKSHKPKKIIAAEDVGIIPHTAMGIRRNLAGEYSRMSYLLLSTNNLGKQVIAQNANNLSEPNDSATAARYLVFLEVATRVSPDAVKSSTDKFKLDALRQVFGALATWDLPVDPAFFYERSGLDQKFLLYQSLNFASALSELSTEAIDHIAKLDQRYDFPDYWIM